MTETPCVREPIDVRPFNDSYIVRASLVYRGGAAAALYNPYSNPISEVSQKAGEQRPQMGRYTYRRLPAAQISHIVRGRHPAPCSEPWGMRHLVY